MHVTRPVSDEDDCAGNLKPRHVGEVVPQHSNLKNRSAHLRLAGWLAAILYMYAPPSVGILNILFALADPMAHLSDP